MNFEFPPCPGIIDVTKPPYSCDPTGREDCTEALCRAIDDIFLEYRHAFEKTVEKVNAAEGDEVWIGFEIRRIRGVRCIIWPEKLPPSHILYFPNGTYSVSDTVTYSLEHFQNIFLNVPYLEMNCRLRLIGQSMEGVTIRLRDNCKGFEYGNDRPVISFMRGEASNIAMTNMLENMTVSIGRGNHGATGVVFFANNTGAVRNVRVISEDEQYGGCAGFEILHDKASACIAENLEVIGFDYGIRVLPQTHFAFFEHIRLRHQIRAGFFVGDTIVSIRDMTSENACPALRMVGFSGHTVATDCTFTGTTEDDYAVRHDFGVCFLNRIRVSGYAGALKSYCGSLGQQDISQFSSHGTFTGLDKTEAHTLNLPVEDTPVLPWEAPENWVSVNSFGAKGDGVTDDTAAIQAALSSGARTVYFYPGAYLISGQIEIPATVERVNFMYADLANTPEMKKQAHTGVFRIVGESGTPLVMEDLFAFEQLSGSNTLVDHASRRTLVLSDLHTQAISMYFNSVKGGKVFLENVGCTLGGIPGTGGCSEEEEKKREASFCYSREIPCYTFTGQQVWARQINPERSKHQIINDHSRLWVFGYKAEEEGTAFETKNGGETEVLGGTLCICYRDRFPAVINRDSRVSFISSSVTYAKGKNWSRLIEEHRGDETETLGYSLFPVKFMDCICVPLYSGDLRKSRT